MRKLALIIAVVAMGCSGKERAFDVAYSSEWKFSVAGPVSGYLVVVNTSEDPLNLSTLQIKNVSDDHASASLAISVTPSNAIIQPGKAAGFVTPLSQKVLLDSGIVKEPRVETSSDLLNIEILNFTDGTYDFHATAEMSLDGVTTALPLTIHVVPGPEIYADPMIGKRVAVSR